MSKGTINTTFLGLRGEMAAMEAAISGLSPIEQVYHLLLGARLVYGCGAVDQDGVSEGDALASWWQDAAGDIIHKEVAKRHPDPDPDLVVG